jgi:hypothetical protein
MLFFFLFLKGFLKGCSLFHSGSYSLSPPPLFFSPPHGVIEMSLKAKKVTFYFNFPSSLVHTLLFNLLY